MPEPLVSIAMPFMNAGRFFAPCLKSIFSQTFQDWELLLIDDGSIDDSPGLAASLTDPRVRYFSDGQNRKLNERLNQAIKLARGKYFFRMDADDLMHPSRIEKQVLRLENRPENTVLGTAAYSIDASSKIVGIRGVPKAQAQGFPARHSFIHPTVAGHTAWFREHRYSTNFLFHRSQDAELWCRTSAVSKFDWLDEPLLFYREQGVFSLSNYFGTQIGILQIASSLDAPPIYRMIKIWRECLKLGIVSSMTIAGRTDTVVRGRYGKLSGEGKTAADAVIASILKTELALASLNVAKAG